MKTVRLEGPEGRRVTVGVNARRPFLALGDVMATAPGMSWPPNNDEPKTIIFRNLRFVSVTTVESWAKVFTGSGTTGAQGKALQRLADWAKSVASTELGAKANA